jgi:hypothetical protein
MSLKHKDKKIKSFYPVLRFLVFINIVVYFVTLASLYKTLYTKEAIKYEISSFSVPSLVNKVGKSHSVSNEIYDENQIIASKHGTKYYYADCSGVNRIKIENRVYFDDFEAAERAGFMLAKNCKKP